MLGINQSYANQNPRGLVTDKRIKIVAFNPNDVVTVKGSPFVSTAIILNKDESIVHVDVGDPLAWKVPPPKDVPYILFIAPQLPQSDTNMTIITSKRMYQFHLVSNQGTNQNITYALQFKYPDDEKNEFENEINFVQKNFLGNHTNDATEWNYDYSFYGSKKIAPIQAVDNGTFTIFKFPKNSVLPAIFAVDDKQNESLVNFRVQGPYVFVQGKHHHFTFRNGQDVTSIYNDNYNLN